jgi:hypothetical protein
MPITRREVLGPAPAEADERRWPKPEQLVCPVCRDEVRPEPPAYWRMADGPVPAWSHINREPLCWTYTDDGIRPAIPTQRQPIEPLTTARATTPSSDQQRVHSTATRDHVLPDEVACNISRAPGLGDRAIWNTARGELLEACRATDAQPLALHYAQAQNPNDSRDWLITITARLRLPTGHEAEFATTRSGNADGEGVIRWDIRIDGELRLRERRDQAPTPAVVGSIIRRALHGPTPIRRNRHTRHRLRFGQIPEHRRWLPPANDGDMQRRRQP